MRTLTVEALDRLWGTQLGFEGADLRGGAVRFVASGQRPFHVLATPDGAVVVGQPHRLERLRTLPVEALLSPAVWAERFGVAEAQVASWGPGLLAYANSDSFTPLPPRGEVRRLTRADAGELARFSRLLAAREPTVFHSWAIGGRVTANERLWGAVVEGKILSVAGLRPVAPGLFEVGINTLPTHRRLGWGGAVASAATEGGLALAPLVQWSAPLDNEPSARIAARLGFQHYAHFLWISLPEEREG